MKKITAIILSMVVIIAVAAFPARAAEEIDKNSATNYPYIFVHGMGGWGTADSYYSISFFTCVSYVI